MPEMVNKFLILTKGKNKINKVDFACLFVCLFIRKIVCKTRDKQTMIAFKQNLIDIICILC